MPSLINSAHPAGPPTADTTATRTNFLHARNEIEAVQDDLNNLPPLIRGATGATGATGVAGTPGTTGSAGETGARGATGATGPAGEAGGAGPSLPTIGTADGQTLAPSATDGELYVDTLRLELWIWLTEFGMWHKLA